MTAKELEKIFARYVLKRWLVLKSKAQTLRLRPRLSLRLTRLAGWWCTFKRF